MEKLNIRQMNVLSLYLQKCLKGKGKCSCVLCKHVLDDGIADNVLQDKFRKLLSDEENVLILDVDLNGYLLAALVALQEKRYTLSLQYLQHYDLHCLDGYFLRTRSFLYYYFALIAYGMEKYAVAEQAFHNFMQDENTKNEIAYLHLGNCYFRQQKWEKALEAYGTALSLRKDFPEATINIGLVAKKIGDDATAKELASNPQLFHGICVRGTLCENPLEYALAIPQGLSIWDIPIFINSRDRLETLKKLLAWLTEAGYRRIFVLDNASSYPPLLDYYRRLDEEVGAIRVLRLNANLGHMALWESGILETMRIDTPYVYTDSDVVPIEECPGDILKDLVQILQKYPFLKKVGLGLKIDDITYFDKKTTEKIESEQYRYQIEDEVYFSGVDTTFALYRNYRHYHLYVSARTTGKRMARHLPWYYDYENLPEDEKYYMNHANRSASFVQRMKDEIKRSGEAKPLVSVIMPVYNAGRFLRESIDSIMGQTYSNWELLAVNDGSTDDSMGILQEYAKNDKRIKILVHERNKGVPAARNTGIKQAKGKYALLLDSDDISTPDRMEKQVNYMEANPMVDVCGTFAQTFGTENEEVWKKPIFDREIKLNLLVGCMFISPSTILRITSLKRYQLLFDESWRIVEDYEFWTRAADRLIYHNLPEVLYLYRITEDSLSHKDPQLMINATHRIIARNLNSLSKYEMNLPALHKSNCSDEDLMVTIHEVKELPKTRKQDCRFRLEEIQVVVDYLLAHFQRVLTVRQEKKTEQDIFALEGL